MRKGTTREKSDSFRFIDLFAGIGGLRIGFEKIGGTCVFTSEWNKYSQQTYLANFGSEHPINGDITQIKVEEIPEHDVLLAGFPCQPFSIAGVSKKNSLREEPWSPASSTSSPPNRRLTIMNNVTLGN